MTSDLDWVNSAASTDGVVGDVNTMRIDPSHLGMAQDVVVDTSGILRSRGAVISATSDTFVNQDIMGVAQTPAGTVLVASDSAGDTYFYGTSATNLTGFAKLVSAQYNNVTANSLTVNGFFGVWSSTKVPKDLGAIFCNQRATTGDVWPSASFYWGGNATLTSQTTAGTASSTIGSKAIVGVGTAWTNALVNSFLYLNGNLVGQVAAVASTTTLTLYKGAYATNAGQAIQFRVARPLGAKVYKGRVTTNVASTTVVGSNTKWNNSGPAGTGATYIGTANMFRYSDGAFIGQINAVVNDTTITLAANAAIALVNEEYYILVGGGGSSVAVNQNCSFFGSCCEFWAGRFWYGALNALDPTAPIPSLNLFGPYQLNAGNSVYFTRKEEAEFLDMDPQAGDFITLPLTQNNDQVRAMCATRGGLVVFRNNDTFLITGYSPETFRAIKIVDDGCLNAWMWKPYKEGVAWAGTNSIWYFDGTRVINLLQNKVSHWYRKSKSISSGINPTGMAVSNDHIIFSVAPLTGFNTWPYKNTTKTLQVATYAINMNNGAVTFFTNLRVTTGFIANSLLSGSPTTPVIIANNALLQNNSVTSYLLNGDKLIQDSSTAANNFDALTTCATFSSGAQIGPDVMFETTKLVMGDGSRLKMWNNFLMNYSGDVSMSGVFIGTNTTTDEFPNVSTGSVSTDTFAASSNVGILKRLRFVVRSSSLAVRVYQTSTTSATSQRFKCLWWSVSGKRMRQGRPNA